MSKDVSVNVDDLAILVAAAEGFYTSEAERRLAVENARQAMDRNRYSGEIPGQLSLF